MLIQLLEIDKLRVERQGLNPLKRDSDKDGLSDSFEATDTGYPLNPDPDHDGLNDKIELYATKTRMDSRDTDLDGIRDGVELGISADAIANMNGDVYSGGSWMERISHSEEHTPYDFSPIANFDADTDPDINTLGLIVTTDPLDPDTDDDGLPDGWVDGWTYDGRILRDTEVKSYNTLLQYEDIYYYRYNPDKWGFGTEKDNLIQIYEGEDYNCDGNFLMQNDWNDGEKWQFYSDTFEPVSFYDFTSPNQQNGKYTFNSETNPVKGDSDEDTLPDGYEVWYSITDPIRMESSGGAMYRYFLNPVDLVNRDDSWDKDLEPAIDDDLSTYDSTLDYDVENEASISLNMKQLDTGTIAYGALIDLSETTRTPSYLPIIGVEYYLDLSQNADTHVTFEVWKYSTSTIVVDKSQMFSQTVNGGEKGWYYFNIPSNLLAFNDESNPPHDNDQDDAIYQGDYGRADRYVVVVRYVEPDETSGTNYNFKCAFDNTGDTSDIYFRQDASGNWATFDKHKLIFRMWTFFNIGVPLYDAGDGIQTKYEYYIGTNPKSKNTDKWRIGIQDYDDGLLDGPEVGRDTGGGVPVGGVIFKTSVKDGAIKFKHYLEAENGDYIDYDGDGESTDIRGYSYGYGTKISNPDSSHLCFSEDNVLLFTLEDGTKIYMSPDSYLSSGSVVPGTTLYLIDPNMKHDEELDTYEGTVIIFDKNGPEIDMSYLTPSTYGTELFLSYPFSCDTDQDGIMDGAEIDWSRESEIYIENQDFNVPVDALINVRDIDSDNDGIEDGMEVAWMLDLDTDLEDDTLENMVDSDSDNDGVMDGDESKWMEDTDEDGTEITDVSGYPGYEYNDGANMLDEDSDNDRLLDGEELNPYILHDHELDLESPATIYSEIQILGSTDLTDPKLITMDKFENIYYFDKEGADYYLRKLVKGYSVTAEETQNPIWNHEDFKNILKTSDSPIDIAVDGSGNIYYIEKTGASYSLMQVSNNYEEHGFDEEPPWGDNIGTEITKTSSTEFLLPSSLKTNSENNLLYIDKDGSITSIMKFDTGYSIDGDKVVKIIDNSIFQLSGREIVAVTENNNGEILFATDDEEIFWLPNNYEETKIDPFNKIQNGILLKKLLDISGIYIADINTDDSGNIFIRESTSPYTITMLPAGYYFDSPKWNELSLKTVARTDQDPIDDYLTKISDFFVTGKGDIYLISDSDKNLMSLPNAKTSMLSVDSDNDRLMDGFLIYYDDSELGEEEFEEEYDNFIAKSIVHIESDPDPLAINEENYIIEGLDLDNKLDPKSFNGKGILFFGELSEYNIYENSFSTERSQSTKFQYRRGRPI
jgi:hypothetical protein